MIKIDIPPDAIKKHDETYTGSTKKRLCDLINKQGNDYAKLTALIKNKTSKGQKAITDRILSYFLHFLGLFSKNNILISPPEKLNEFIGKEKCIAFLFAFNEEEKNIRNTIFENIFSYDNFSKGISVKKNEEKKTEERWNAWTFLKMLNVKVCTYCNADIVFATIKYTMKDNKITGKEIRSAFDHYFPQLTYPYLAISLYNLVPTCTRCNTNIKGTRDLIYGTHTHPYNESFHDGIKFRTDIKKLSGFFENTEGFRLELVKKDSELADKSEKTAEFFSLVEIYNDLFKQEAADVLTKKHCGVKSYREFLEGKGISPQDIDRLIWGTSLNPAEINRHRLSKMTIDLLED